MNSARLPRSSRLDVQAVGEAVRLEVRQVGRVELPNERVGEVRQHAATARSSPERLDGVRQIAQRDRVDRQRHRRRTDAATGGLVQATQHEGRHHVVDVDQVHVARRVGDLDRQVVGDVVAERGDDRVVVRPAPLAEDVLQPEDHDRRRRSRCAELRSASSACRLLTP